MANSGLEHIAVWFLTEINENYYKIQDILKEHYPFEQNSPMEELALYHCSNISRALNKIEDASANAGKSWEEITHWNELIKKYPLINGFRWMNNYREYDSN